MEIIDPFLRILLTVFMLSWTWKNFAQIKKKCFSNSLLKENPSIKAIKCQKEFFFSDFQTTIFSSQNFSFHPRRYWHKWQWIREAKNVHNQIKVSKTEKVQKTDTAFNLNYPIVFYLWDTDLSIDKVFP